MHYIVKEISEHPMKPGPHWGLADYDKPKQVLGYVVVDKAHKDYYPHRGVAGLVFMSREEAEDFAGAMNYGWQHRGEWV